MRQAVITRGQSTDEGTFSLVTFGDKTRHVLELPWRDNHVGKSCIPVGVYPCIWHRSPSKGWVYLLQNTAPRTNVLIHSANFGGDEDLGWETQLQGCIAIGRNLGTLNNNRGMVQNALLGSRFGCDDFYRWANQKPVELIIK